MFELAVITVRMVFGLLSSRSSEDRLSCSNFNSIGVVCVSMSSASIAVALKAPLIRRKAVAWSETSCFSRPLQKDRVPLGAIQMGLQYNMVGLMTAIYTCLALSRLAPQVDLVGSSIKKMSEPPTRRIIFPAELHYFTGRLMCATDSGPVTTLVRCKVFDAASIDRAVWD